MFLICLSHNSFQQLLRHSGAGMENPRVGVVHSETARGRRARGLVYRQSWVRFYGVWNYTILEVFFKTKIRNCEFTLTVLEGSHEGEGLQHVCFVISWYICLCVQRSCLNNGPWAIPHLKTLHCISKVQIHKNRTGFSQTESLPSLNFDF